MRYGFGVDVGGTTVKLGFFSEAGDLMEKWEIPTNTTDGGKQILPDIAAAIADCLTRSGVSNAQVLGIGIGVPGPVDDEGVINRCVNLGWGVFNLDQTLQELTGLPVKAGNDANLAALGEVWKGGGMGSQHTLLVTLGTGIGGGLVLNGEIVAGSHGVAGEIGHITVNPSETACCTCGKKGCVEQYASATGIVRLAQRCLDEQPQSSILRKMDDFSCKDVFSCAAQGDRLAQEALNQAYDYLGMAIADACCIFDPGLVLLGGGVSKAGQVLLDGVTARFRAHMFHASKDTRLALATLGNDAGIYGGFRLALSKFGA